MAPFFPIYIRRSDGKLSVQKNASLKATKEPNEPLPEQLISKPNAQGISDYYRLCQPGHAKETDWRRKLGGMLIRELGSPEMQDKNHILSALPENYRLYEHLRVKTIEGNATDTKSKTHAGGGNERQDAYLYGYPQGRKKRFRSPAEFFPHLLWLATDESGDPNNCTCRFCSPEEVEIEGEANAKAPKQASKVETHSRVPSGSSALQTPASKSPQQALAAPQAPALPRVRSYEQTLDMGYNKFLFRPGEVVWFQRGMAWGLGTVVQRSMLSINPPKYQYRIQPLSHPLNYPQAASCTQDQIRNWLAWSPPPCISQDLNPSPANGMISQKFEAVNWKAYLSNPKMSPQDAEVDGSILAAKAVETTYTLFELLNSTSSTAASSQASEKYYNGIFLGAEKIWLGDALRLRGSQNAPSGDVLVLQQILERQHPSDPSRSAILFIGPIYSPTVAPSGSASIPKTNDHLPLRMRSDLAIKNQFAKDSRDPAKRNQTHYWRLVNPEATLTFSDIKGRWYEASLLMPILSPTEYTNDKARGDLGDAGMWMNGHGDCNKPLNKGPEAAPFESASVKFKKREEAFGKSVPATMKILLQEKETKPTGNMSSVGSPTSATGSRTGQVQSQLGPTSSATGQAQSQVQGQVQTQAQGHAQGQASANTSKSRQGYTPAATSQSQAQPQQPQQPQQGQQFQQNQQPQQFQRAQQQQQQQLSQQQLQQLWLQQQQQQHLRQGKPPPDPQVLQAQFQAHANRQAQTQAQSHSSNQQQQQQQQSNPQTHPQIQTYTPSTASVPNAHTVFSQPPQHETYNTQTFPAQNQNQSTQHYTHLQWQNPSYTTRSSHPQPSAGLNTADNQNHASFDEFMDFDGPLNGGGGGGGNRAGGDAGAARSGAAGAGAGAGSGHDDSQMSGM